MIEVKWTMSEPEQNMSELERTMSSGGASLGSIELKLSR
jgi:hypothetical protein